MTFLHNFTNEGGAFGTNRLLKNVMGLWILQECRRCWDGRGEDCTYDRLEEEALKAQPFKCFIDPDDSRFVEPGEMLLKIDAFCRETGQKAPETKGEYIRCIRESLALKYRLVLEKIVEITGRDCPVVHIVGGGALDSMLCGFTAGSTRRKVVAGPAEATAIGNIMMQAFVSGEVSSLREIRQMVRNSFPLAEYEPGDVDGWNDSYLRFLKLLNQS